MSLRTWGPGKEVNGPRGMWSSLAQKRKGSPTRASFMQNMRVSPGIVASRPGTSRISSSGGRVTGMTNWITPTEANLLLLLDNDGTKGDLKALDTTTFVPTFLYSTPASTRSAVFAELDIWQYVAGYDVNGDGTIGVQIFDGTNTDTAFRAPVALVAATATDAGAGQCTEGTHYFGFVYQNRTGYSGVPSTLVGASKISVVLGTDAQLIDISVTLPALADGGGNSTLYLIATRADSPDKFYFIPSDVVSGSIGEQPVPHATPVTLNFVMNFSDGDVAQLDDASDQFFLLAQDAAGNPPIKPSFVVAYGQRMVYGDGTRLLVSDVNEPQQVANDRNGVTMPNQRKIGFGFQLPNSPEFYLTGDRWTAKINDDSDIPATWGQPVGVSNALGAKYPSLVCSRTGGNYAWVVTEGGVYLFTGTYSDKPVTYLIADQWARVNWLASYAIEIRDDTVGLRLYVAVPLDAETECSHMFVIDYTSGVTYDQVDIGIDKLGQVENFTSIAVVKEPLTKLSNVWLSGVGAGILRFDSTTKNDSEFSIPIVWESGLIRGAQDFAAKTIRVGAMDIWARGIAPLGALKITLFGPDKQQSVDVPLLSTQGVESALSPTPGLQYMSKFDISKIENYTVRFELNVNDAYFELSGFTPYAKPDIINR